MKILYFSHQANFVYGGEICNLEIMNCARKDHDICFAAPEGAYSDRAREYSECIPVPSKEFRRELWRLPGFLQAWCATHNYLRQVIKSRKVDLVHANSLKAMVYLWLLGKKKVVPIVWHHYDILPDSFGNRMWLRMISRSASKIIVPSEASKTALVKAGIKSKKIDVIMNGFSPQAWTKREVPASRDRFVVGVVGEISYRKGSDWIKPIADYLARAGVDKFCIRVVGEGLSDPEFADRVREENRVWTEKSLVEFLGRRSDVPELLKDMDVLIVPSRQDPLPTVITEASFSGVPVLARPVGGIPEMIENDVTGCLCATPEEFGARIVELAEDRGRLRQMGTKARGFAEVNFSSQKMWQEVSSVYQALA